MMHRYVSIISTSPASSSHDEIWAQLGLGTGWERALRTSRASAWVWSRAPSRLNHRMLNAMTCVIGLDFAARSDVCDEKDGAPVGLLSARWGAYVALRVDPDSGAVSVLRDPSGRIECWRLKRRDYDIVFSHYGDVIGQNPNSDPIDWQYIAYHLNNTWLHGDRTGISNVTEILPGEELVFDGQAVRRIVHWSPGQIAKDSYSSREEAGRAIRASAERAVSAWAARYDRIVLDLSGGLDSAIVLGLLRRHAGHPNVVGINYVTNHSESDERHFARDAADLHGVRLIEQTVSSQTVGRRANFSMRLLRPTVRLMSLGYDELGGAIAEKLSAEAFFTGSGGDHLFFDNISTRAIADYRRQNGFDSKFVATAHELARLSKNTIWNAFGVAIKDCLRAAPQLADLVKLQNPFLAGDAASFSDYERFAHPWVVDARSHMPPEKLRQIVNLVELQRHYWRYGRGDIAQEVHPLISQPLIEASLRTPTYWFASGGVQRGLARDAFADLLPASIRERRNKGANTSHRVQMMLRELPWIRAMLLEGRLAAEGLVDRTRLEAALQPMVLSAGADIWRLTTCLTTEMWIQQMEADHRVTAPERLAG